MAVPLTLSSVPAQTPYVQYVSSSGQTVFPYPFEITQDSDLVCLINGVAQPTDGGYTLSGQGSTNGGNLTFTVGQTAGTIITLYRNISIARITQLSQNGTFFAANFNNEFNRVYLIMQQLQQSLLPGGNQAYALMVPNSNNPTPTTLLTPSNYANKYLSFDANGNPQPAALTSSGAITTAILAPFLNLAQTAAEISAGIVPANLQYPPGYVDRYLTNTVPGTTDMSPAFNAAIKQAKNGGVAIRWGATAPYGVSNPINGTSGLTDRQYGMVFRCENGPEMGNVPPGPSIVANHAGHVFDLTGTIGAVFENVSIGVGATSPQTAFFQARLQSSLGSGHVGPSCGISRFMNCSTLGSFTKAAYYNYAAEDDQLVGCYFNNSYSGAGGKVVVFTANNIMGLSSTFQTVASGIAQSCIDHKVFGGEFYMQSGNATADCFSIEQSDTVKMYGPWMYCSDGANNGRSLIYVDPTNASSNYCSINGLTGEQTTKLQNYGILFGNAAVTHLGWSLNDCKLPNGTLAISSGASVTLDNFKLQGLNVPVGGGITISGTLQNSPSFAYGNEADTVTIGTSSGNCLTGDTSLLVVATRQHDSWIETGSTNRSFAPGITTATHGWTLVGALTQRAEFTYEGNKVSFNILLQGATSVAWIANATIPVLPGVATDLYMCQVYDATAGTVQGVATLTAGSGNTTLTLLNAQTTSAHEFVISGWYFVA